MNKSRSSRIAESMLAACRQAGEIIRRDFAILSGGGDVSREIKTTDRHDLPDYATKTDVQAEMAMQRFLAGDQPDIPFIGEEGGQSFENLDRFFLVDPLDGTTNFFSLKSHFAISAAYIENDTVKAAVVMDPVRMSWVYACAGEGAYSEQGNRLKLAGVNNLKELQLECEFPLRNEDEISILTKLLGHTAGFRKSGSTALTLANQAKGQKSAVLSSCLNPYDVAAGLLIAQEAGATVTDLQGNEANFRSSSIISARADMHAQIIGCVVG